jgi:hypothetical protein
VTVAPATAAAVPTAAATAAVAAARRECVLKVLRACRPPAPWVWEIHTVMAEAEPVLHRSTARYRSADEAWAAGLPALDAVRRIGRRATRP